MKEKLDALYQSLAEKDREVVQREQDRERMVVQNTKLLQMIEEKVNFINSF